MSYFNIVSQDVVSCFSLTSRYVVTALCQHHKPVIIKTTTRKPGCYFSIAGLDMVSYCIMPNRDVPIYLSFLSQEHVVGYCGITSQGAVGGQQLLLASYIVILMRYVQR